jgi:hypothetical protein
MGASLGNLGEGAYARGLCVEEGSGTGVSPYRRRFLRWGPRWETWERAHMPGSYAWKKVLGKVSVCIGVLLDTWGEGTVYQDL